MRIVLIGPTYPFRGGISHYTTLLFRHLKKRHDTLLISFSRQYPKVLFPGKTDKDPSEKPIREAGVLPLIDSMNPITWVNAALRIIRGRAELVILQWWVSFWAPQFWTISTLVRLFSQAKILYLCHNLVEHESRWIDKILTRMVLSTGDFFIVHSEEERRDLLTMFPEARIQKSPHPTYEVFNFKPFDLKKVKEKYGLQGNIIIFFGFVREYKGLRYLIEALPQVLSEIDVTLLVVGEFWRDKDNYLRLIKEKDVESAVVIVDKYVPNEEIGSYFSAADLVVQPYISATGSGVIQTAFGFNKPVIVTKVGSLPEMVEDGKTGFLVPPRDPEGLASAILRFFREDKSEEFSNNIREERGRFSWERMVKTIESLTSVKAPFTVDPYNANRH
jgi:glycosyltransferase involved in cell wall biosynthesis